MKILGIDFGAKRIGIARSTSQTVAMELTTLGSVKEVADLIERECPDQLVVGLPKSATGGFGASALIVKTQTDRLQQLLAQRQINLPIKFANEYLTSFEAEDQLRTQGVKLSELKNRIDQRAAKIILEQWLNEHKIQKNLAV